MDPNANLKEQLELAASIHRKIDNEHVLNDDEAGRLADLVIALNDWITGGGFLPDTWGSLRMKRKEADEV
jgi:hypothetical protein